MSKSTPLAEKHSLMTIRIRAEAMTKTGEGIFEIDLKVRPLSPGETTFLRELFPNTQEAVYDLLATEALLAAIER